MHRDGKCSRSVLSSPPCPQPLSRCSSSSRVPVETVYTQKHGLDPQPLFFAHPGRHKLHPLLRPLPPSLKPAPRTTRLVTVTAQRPPGSCPLRAILLRRRATGYLAPWGWVWRCPRTSLRSLPSGGSPGLRCVGAGVGRGLLPPEERRVGGQEEETGALSGGDGRVSDRGRAQG